VANGVALQEAIAEAQLDVIGQKIKGEDDPDKVGELGREAGKQQKVVTGLTNLRNSLGAKPLEL